MHKKVKKVAKKFGGKEKMSTFAIPNEKNGSPNAEIAQLVEHNLAKVGVASSSLVFRSKSKSFEDKIKQNPLKHRFRGFSCFWSVKQKSSRLFLHIT